MSEKNDQLIFPEVEAPVLIDQLTIEGIGEYAVSGAEVTVD